MSSYQNVSQIRVFPGIGVARVGNSPDYFIGPETPGVIPDPGNGQYKDASGALKPQAQRFRVFGFDDQGGLQGEIVHGDTVNGVLVEIAWTAHLTNMKAANYAFQGQYGFDPSQLRNANLLPGVTVPAQRKELIIDPGPKAIQGAGQGPVELLDTEGDGSTIFDVQSMAPAGGYKLSGLLKFDPPTPPDQDCMVAVEYSAATVSLGSLRTDEQGRLIVVGGKGESRSCTTPAVVISKITHEPPNPNPEFNGNSYFNNPGWYDDTAGGSIDAALVESGSGKQLFTTKGDATATGWLAVAPPNYSPSTDNVVSLLDLQLDLYPEQDPYSGQGPIFYAITGTNQRPYIASSTDGTSFDFQLAESLGALTALPPALAMFDGKLYYAITGTDGRPYIASSADGTSFEFTQADTEGALTGLPPALAVFDGTLFYAITGTDGRPYIGSSTDGTIFAFRPAAPAGQVTTGLGPSLAAFNGRLYYAITGTNDRPYIAASTDGSSFSFELAAPAGQVTQRAPALASFKGQLCYAITGTDQRPYIAVSSDGATFDFRTAAPEGQITDGGPALSVFNGRLYYAITSTDERPYIASASDVATLPPPGHSTFTFQTAAPAGQVTRLAPALATLAPVNFFRDIYPIFKIVTDYAWTNLRAYHGHRPGAQGDFLREGFLELLADPSVKGADARNLVFRFIRPPAMEPSPPVPPPPAPAPKNITTDQPQRGDLMPRLFGNGGSPEENEINKTTFPNQWLSLTDHQLSKFQKWVNGDFEPGTPGTQRWQDLQKDNPPQALNFAALQPTVGGGFHPGIELTYLMHERTFFQEAFRFAAGTIPGAIAAYMSVPWQGDFWSCNISWWPAIRPDVVIQRDKQSPPLLTPVPWFRSSTIPPNADSISDYEGGYQTMVTDWPRFGLVTPVPTETDQGEPVYQEVERDPGLDVASLIASVSGDLKANGNVLAQLSSSVIVADPNGIETSQEWRLLSYTGSPQYFFVSGGTTGDVLTAAFSSGDLSIEPQKSPADDSQLWQYLPSGYPGIFLMQSKLNLQVLTSQGAGKPAVTAEQSNSAIQYWLLLAAPSEP